MRASGPLLLGLACLLAGCAAERPAGVPFDVPDPADVVRHDLPGFAVWVDRGCLTGDELEALEEELARARERIEGWLGAALAPGEFGRPGERPACPADLQRAAPRKAGTIEVVIVAEGDRCHADAQGIVVTRDHLPRQDATHELVHYLAGASWHPLDEGFAVWLTEELWGPDKGWSLEVRARAYRDLSHRVSLSPEHLRGGMDRRDYDVAGAFVGWLIRTHGKEKFLRLYAGPERDYWTVYGTGERELEDRFWKHVASLRVRHDPAYHTFMAHLSALSGRR